MPTDKTTILRLYRAILRECTYLIDPASRIYVRHHVANRFRQHKVTATDPQRRVKSAKHALSVLSRANRGCQAPFFKILCLTYGRTGARRHELLEQAERLAVLLPKERGLPAAGDYDYMRKQVAKRFTLPEAALKLIPRISPLMLQLLRSQEGQVASSITKLKPGQLTIDIPKLNTWGRQMPFKRIKNKSRQWYATLRAKVLPPLPPDEWHRLANLASGTSRIPSMVPRRTRVEAISTAQDDGDLAELLGQLGLRTRYTNSDGASRPHRLTARFLQRRYSDILAMTPLMRWDKDKAKWDILWGAAKIRTRSILTSNNQLKDSIDRLVSEPDASPSDCEHLRDS